MDTVSAEVRSSVMRAVRGTGNKSTEWRLRAAMMRAGLRGWRLNPPGIAGKPDFAFAQQKVTIFVDGCFWHGCPSCYRRPSSNQTYWDAKVQGNRSRDRRVAAALKLEGWRVIRVWEHQLATMPKVIKRIVAALNEPGQVRLPG
jgi:DNA mismatch endonuclease, patch repair protein